MYRLLPIDKDGYITNKLVAGSGSITSNVGQAGTLDLFKIYTSGSDPELSRLLVHANLDPLRELTGSFLNLNSPTFKAYLSLKDIYGGQTTPSNFTVSLVPLTKNWDEGRGFDIKAFRDLDSANWVTASVSAGTATPWAVTGANGVGTDITGSEITQTFARGDEDLLMDVTTLVSSTLAGVLGDYGWRIAFTGSLEGDTNTYFVKRFGSRHTSNPNLHPKLVVKYNEVIQDDSNQAFFGQTNDIFAYNLVGDGFQNFVSGSTQITGSNSLKLVLVASQSVQATTSSWQQNFSASITYITTSFSFYSSSVTASQPSLGNLPLIGYYHASVSLNPQTDLALQAFLGISKSLGFQTYWTSLDDTVVYSTGSYLTLRAPQVQEQVSAERNFVLNVTNLKTEYVQDQVVRLRVFVQDRNIELPAFRLATPAKSTIFKKMYWRLKNAFGKDVVIPFDTSATKLSVDGYGMYFDMYMQDLDPQVVYELEFQITEGGRDYFITAQGFRFKVVP